MYFVVKCCIIEFLYLCNYRSDGRLQLLFLFKTMNNKIYHYVVSLVSKHYNKFIIRGPSIVYQRQNVVWLMYPTGYTGTSIVSGEEKHAQLYNILLLIQFRMFLFFSIIINVRFPSKNIVFFYKWYTFKISLL